MSRLNRTLPGVPGASGAHVPGVRDLGAYLREQRQNAKLSVRQLSKAAGISNPYLSQIERGLRRPSAEILQALAKGLEVSAESLYQQAGLLDMPTAQEQAAAAEATSQTGATGAATNGAGTAGTAGPAGAASDTRVAIEADPRLTARQRRLLLDLYDSFVDPGESLDDFIDATLADAPRTAPPSAAARAKNPKNTRTSRTRTAAERPQQGAKS